MVEGKMVGAHDPREWGYKATCQHATTIPGFWPDESRQHGESVFLVEIPVGHRFVILHINLYTAQISDYKVLFPQACF